MALAEEPKLKAALEAEGWLARITNGPSPRRRVDCVADSASMRKER